MIFVNIIFFISIFVIFGMLAFRMWEIKNSIRETPKINKLYLQKIQFRHVEKNMLYLAKHILQRLIFSIAKYWFVSTTKVRKKVNEKWPKINSYLGNNPELNTSHRHSFVKKAILESKAKIKRIKEKVIKDIEENRGN